MKGRPQEPYRICYADPPWKYRDSANAGERGAVHKYAVMNTEEICAMPVHRLMHRDSVLFLWATCPLLFGYDNIAGNMPGPAAEVMTSWGYRYKGVAFAWVKTCKTREGFMWGMGNYTRQNLEVCLIGIRGEGLERKSAGVHQVVAEPSLSFSQKPDTVRKRIVTLYGRRKRIELFARQTAPGWDRWGNQAPEGDGHVAELRAVVS